RKHVEILWDGTRAQVNDLGSTNGSLLNGTPVAKAPLAPDSVIDIGRTRIVFRVLAQAAEVDQFADLRNDRPGGAR
ncbi:MAG TPA: FHA domain-containing protein, partial [Rhodoglobus sp.]|nr:FHA domain-containing protein [Rhodoglobus sp.]